MNSVKIKTANGLRLMADVVAKEDDKTLLVICQNRLVRVKMMNGFYQEVKILSVYCQKIG